MKYILKQIEPNGNCITHEFDVQYLEDMLYRLRYFIAGSGWSLGANEDLIIDQTDLFIKSPKSIGKSIRKRNGRK